MKIKALNQIINKLTTVQTVVSCPLDNDIEIKGIAYDSRKVKDGFAFVAAVGAVSDGHTYIPKAIENGAIAIVCESKDAFEKYSNEYSNVAFYYVESSRKALALLSAEFFGNPANKLKLIALTGTKGKTSTSFMVSGVLTEAGKNCAIIGTTGIYYAGKYEYIDNSTPESYELHRLFADMVENGVEYCVMEVSSQALMMYRVYGIRFNIGVFTNISPDHIGEGEHKTFEEYLYYKTQLFTMCDNAIVNAESDCLDKVLAVIESENVPCYKYSTKDVDADFIAENERFYIDVDMKTEFVFKTKSGISKEIQVMVPGRFSVYNSLCAASVATVLGINPDDIAVALSKVKVMGRTEPVRHEKAKNPIIIDYAHNAMSMESLFAAIRIYNPSRIICVFGCGGNRSKLRRYDMGEISGKYADLSVITSDNPRDEEVDDIINDILVGLHKTNGKYVIVKDRREAIHYAIENANPEDVILLVGKGHQLYEEIKGKKYHFDEREVVKEYYDSL